MNLKELDEELREKAEGYDKEFVEGVLDALTIYKDQDFSDLAIFFSEEESWCPDHQQEEAELYIEMIRRVDSTQQEESWWRKIIGLPQKTKFFMRERRIGLFGAVDDNSIESCWLFVEADKNDIDTLISDSGYFSKPPMFMLRDKVYSKKEIIAALIEWFLSSMELA